jgi:hypothetical protein
LSAYLADSAADYWFNESGIDAGSLDESFLHYPKKVRRMES